MGLVWFLYSGASFHMTGDKYLFSDLDEKDLGVHIEMGDDGRYSATVSGPFPLRGSLVNLSY